MIPKKYLEKLGYFKKCANLLSSNGNYIPNQQIIVFENGEVFVSYNSPIVIRFYGGDIIIGKDYDYSRTTGKYRNMYLDETLQETKNKIKNGEYVYDEEL